MYKDRLITQENMVEIVADALEFKRSDTSSKEAERNKRFIGTITYNIEETMINNRFILDKWQKQQRID
jgi:hypothetical protein